MPNVQTSDVLETKVRKHETGRAACVAPSFRLPFSVEYTRLESTTWLCTSRARPLRRCAKDRPSDVEVDGLVCSYSVYSAGESTDNPTAAYVENDVRAADVLKDYSSHPPFTFVER